MFNKILISNGVSWTNLTIKRKNLVRFSFNIKILNFHYKLLFHFE